MNFEWIAPNSDSAEVIRKWRNDPVSLANSLTYTKEKTLEKFFPEFLRNYYSIAALPPVFASEEGKRVGVLRFDPATALEGNHCKAAEISLLVAPEFRKRGLGQKILAEIEPLLKRQGIQVIVAKIKKSNLASIQTFTHAGYVYLMDAEGILHFEKKIADSRPHVFIIAEAGSNWHTGDKNKDYEQASALIHAAKNAGADAIKFQVFRAKDTYVPNPGESDYLKSAGIARDIKSLFEELEMPDALVYRIAEECRRLGIEFMASVFSQRDFDLIDPLVKRHKIASYEISHVRLIELAARSGKPLILSTGAANPADIDWAVETFKKNGGSELTLLQCTARYPAALRTLNLAVIPWLCQRYQVESGLSDHSIEPFDAPLAAVALGAKVIEKHFTLSRGLPGPDHSFAIEPKELVDLVKFIRVEEQMLGSPVKKVLPEEKELYYFARRGIQALRDIQQGEILTEGVNVGILRPGKRTLGIHPRYLPQMEGKNAVRPIALGEGLQITDF